MTKKQKEIIARAISSLEAFVRDQENEKKQKQDELINELRETVDALALVVESLALRELAR